MIIDRYYYQQLNKTEQAIYKAFYAGVMNHKSVIPIPVKGKITEDIFSKIFSAITRDNPLIYYLNQSACSYAKDALGHIAICPQYFFSEKKIKELNKKIETEVNDLARKLDLINGSEYEKVIKVHDWLCNFVNYDNDGADVNNPIRFVEAHNILGVFAHHRGQCEGIAKAVKVLLNAVDIKCIVVTGYADGNGQNGPHAWNIVKIDGQPYQMDVTWDIGVMGKNKDRIAYDYFNLTDAQINIDHKADEVLPVCDSIEYNYFRKNKLVFKSKAMLMAYIDSSLRKGKTDFYFQLDKKMKAQMQNIVNDVTQLAAKILCKQGQNGVRVQHIPNEKLGICWIRVF